MEEAGVPRGEAIETASKVNGWDASAKLKFRDGFLRGETPHVYGGLS